MPCFNLVSLWAQWSIGYDSETMMNKMNHHSRDSKQFLFGNRPWLSTQDREKGIIILCLYAHILFSRDNTPQWTQGKARGGSKGSQQWSSEDMIGNLFIGSAISNVWHLLLHAVVRATDKHSTLTHRGPQGQWRLCDKYTSTHRTRL